ncbi:MAG: hypothetical protein J6B96_02560 [Agathobacter sp.]|nr:hypothetical protein [Agathobacter sp.]
MAEQNVKTKTPGIVAWGKERIRKILVAIKRNPQAVPLLALTVSFLVFSLNLTDISNTTAKIMGAHMGLAEFVSMLLSILSFVCMLNAFPKRQKPNWIMIALMYVMYIIVILADMHYIGRIDYALTRPENPIEPTQYIYNAKYYLSIHIVTIIITMVTIALEPLFAKLFKMINTSIDVETNGELDAIDISDED